MSAETYRFARVAFSIFDGQQRLGHVTESASVNGKFDVYIDDEFVDTVSTRNEARNVLFAALDGPRGAK
jgi:hypothetical protein